MKYIALMFILASCTLFKKGEQKDDELVQLTNEVLKKNEGIEIDVKPLERNK